LQASAAPDHKTLQSQIRQTAGKRLLLNTLEIVHHRLKRGALLPKGTFYAVPHRHRMKDPLRPFSPHLVR
jgi:hypothetical protein